MNLIINKNKNENFLIQLNVEVELRKTENLFKFKLSRIRGKFR